MLNVELRIPMPETIAKLEFLRFEKVQPLKGLRRFAPRVRPWGHASFGPDGLNRFLSAPVLRRLLPFVRLAGRALVITINLLRFRKVARMRKVGIHV